VTFGNPFNATAALKDLQDYYQRKAQREDDKLRRNEERRREEEGEERRRDAELDYERALADARKTEREAREAEERAHRNEEAERRRQEFLDELARARAKEDAELSAEEDQRIVERARRFAQQSLERLQDSAVAKTLVKDVSAGVDFARAQTQAAFSPEGAVERLRGLLEDPVGDHDPGPLSDGIATLQGIFDLAEPEGGKSLGAALGGWLGDQVHENLVDDVTRGLQDRLNRAIGVTPCDLPDGETSKACDEAWRVTNPINLLRGPRNYLEALLKAHLDFLGMAIPRIQGE
jgi:hypothetical protein